MTETKPATTTGADDKQPAKKQHDMPPLPPLPKLPGRHPGPEDCGKSEGGICLHQSIGDLLNRTTPETIEQVDKRIAELELELENLRAVSHVLKLKFAKKKPVVKPKDETNPNP